ncbi:MAG: M15 family metallopeptidase [Actinomycetota bacterium]
MTRRRLGGNVAAALIGALVGALVVLGADGLTRTIGRGAGGAEERVARSPDEPRPRTSAHGNVLLAWSPRPSVSPLRAGGLPANTEAVLEAMRGVRGATTVIAGVDWMSSTRAADGTKIDSPRRGLSIPIEAAIVKPREYASFVPAPERDAVLALGEGEVLLAETEAELRGAGGGLTMRMTDGRVRVASVVSDIATNGYEVLMRGSVPEGWTRADRFVLLRLDHAGRRRAVRRRILSLLPAGSVLRIRSQRETPFLRYGDAVQPQLMIKKSFGEFAARPLPDGRISIDPGWISNNIRRARVPILGRVACHRALFPQLRGALRDVRANGIAYVINPQDFGGCFSPRFISRQPGGRLSHHAWGIALDFNVSENGFGTKADQDERLVETMEAWGFTWGGRWLIPDGMHFEWNRWP